MVEQYWKTNDGRHIAVSDMIDNHLVNAYKMMKRKGFIGCRTLEFYLTCTPPTSDAAEMAFEQEQRWIFDSPVSHFVDLFEDEMNKRGIKIPDVDPDDYGIW